MPLYKLHDFDPSYRDNVDENDVKGFDVYSQTDNEKIGKVHDILVDDSGKFRYLIIDTGFWVFGKKVLLPVGLSRIDQSDRKIYANLSKEQAENLPELNDDLKIDRDYEEQVRGVYRPSTASYAATPVADASAPLNSSYSDATLGSTAAGTVPVDQSNYALSDRADYATSGQTDYDVSGRDADFYDYDREPAYYGLNDRDHQTLRLYQERLLANKNRVKTGDVAVGKRVETETQHVSVPLEKERVVIERTTPTGAETAVSPGAANFQEGEVARVEVYEEVPDIRKEAFVREEVQVRKEVSQERADADETLRREELEIDTDGNPVIDRRPQ